MKIYKRFTRNNKLYISFKTWAGDGKTRTVTRRLYTCKPSKTHSGQFFITDYHKFYPDDDAITDI